MHLQLPARGKKHEEFCVTPRDCILVKHPHKNLASTCVTCPHRASGLCGTLLGPPSEEAETEQQEAWQRFLTARAGEQLAVRNRISSDVFVVCNGWAFRYFQLADGRRQILKFLLPGDLFSPITIFENAFHFSVKALTEVQLSGFALPEIRVRFAVNPEVRSAIDVSCVTESREAAELATALGQLSAEERIAYLLLHLMSRIAKGSVIRDQRYPFPLRQQHIADTVGLTPVHVSRVLGAFRDRRLLALSEGVLTVFNLPELQRIGTLN
jgi:CRP-like cAMP-binding protein